MTGQGRAQRVDEGETPRVACEGQRRGRQFVWSAKCKRAGVAKGRREGDLESGVQRAEEGEMSRVAREGWRRGRRRG